MSLILFPLTWPELQGPNDGLEFPFLRPCLGCGHLQLLHLLPLLLLFIPLMLLLLPLLLLLMSLNMLL